MFSIRCSSCVKSGRNKKKIHKELTFINKYNWEGKNVPSEQDGWKKFGKNNVTIVLNVLHAKKEKIYPAYVSKQNSNREKQVILLLIPNREKMALSCSKKIISIIKRNNIKK